MRAGSAVGLARASLCASLAAMALAGAAQAAPVTIAGPGSGAGKVEDPVGVAVDPSNGDLYVADRANYRIDRFDSEGKFLLAWGWGVADGRSQEEQVCGPAAEPPTRRCFLGEGANTAAAPGAVIPDGVTVGPEGDIYVAESVWHRVSKFTPAGEFLLMAGKEVNATEHANLCTAADVQGGDECGKGEEGSGESQEFVRPRSLAFDPAGNLWVGDAGRIVGLEPSGAYLSQATVPGGGGAVKSLAIDAAGNFYLKSQSLAGARKYCPSGSPVDTLTPCGTFDEEGRAEALTLASVADVYVGDCESEPGDACPVPYRFKSFAPGGEQRSQFGAGQVLGRPGVDSTSGGNPLAIDGARGYLYAASTMSAPNSYVQRFPLPEPGPLPEAPRAEALLPTTATLAATLNPEGAVTHYRFEYLTEAQYQANLAESRPGFEGAAQSPEEELPSSGYEPETASAQVEGLIPETAYRLRIVAENPDGETEAGASFATPPAVLVDAQWASEVAARSASLHAELNPLGVKAEWKLQYGASPCSGGGCEETEWAHLPAGSGEVQVGVSLANLDPHTTYFYRFVAEDTRDGVQYTVEGPDRRFTTRLGSLGFALPDNRAWEMVSPADKHGARIVFPEVGQGGQLQAAANGESLAYLSLGSVQEDPEGNRSLEASSVLAHRGAGGEWASEDITAPHEYVSPFATGGGLEYKLFSPDLSAALLETRDGTPLAPYAIQRTPYLRTDTSPPAYTPLVVGCPSPPAPCPAAVAAHANVAPIDFGNEATSALSRVTVWGATPDLGHVLLGPQGLGEGSSAPPLFEGDAPYSLYERSGGAIVPVSLPETGAEHAVNAEPGSGPGTTRGAISEDGSRVFWSEGNGGHLGHLYVRDTARGETARLDVVQPGGYGVGEAAPIFQGASAAGDVALFTDTQQLSEDSSESGADLYRCAVTVEGGELGCRISDLTGGFPESAEVLGLLPGVSEDAASAYLVARGVLDQAPNSNGDVAVAGQPNLYLWRQGEGIRFVATLAEEDEHDWGGPRYAGSIYIGYHLAAASSPSGRYLAFSSERGLTGYDNRDARTGEADQEVFLYDSATGELACPSCNPSGGRPEGAVGGEEALPEGLDPQALWGGRALAASLPEATKISRTSGISLYRPRAVHDDGRVFFNALDSLVPADSNANSDVYQYEPHGTGDCSASSSGPSLAQSGGGCVALLSSGAAAGGAAFLDASASGNGVFFTTPGQLSVNDEDRVTDIYDARVDGVPATRAPEVECLGEACQPAASAPQAKTPASALFHGAGNLSAAPRCAPLARRVRGLSRRARTLRRHARKMARHPARRRRRRARTLRRRSQRLARRAKATARQTRRCRRARRKAARR